MQTIIRAHRNDCSSWQSRPRTKSVARTYPCPEHLGLGSRSVQLDNAHEPQKLKDFDDTSDNTGRLGVFSDSA